MAWRCQAKRFHFLLCALRTTKKKRGYTLIEIAIVILIIGALMTMSFRLIDTFVGADTGSEPKFPFEMLFQMARNRALSTGKQYTLEINLERKKLSIRNYSSMLDQSSDEAIDKLTLTQAKLTMAQLDSDADKEAKQKALQEEQKKTEYLVKDYTFSESIVAVYSTAKLKIPSPIIRAFFYPNGSSDSLIFQIGAEQNARYLYLPRYNAPARYLTDFSLENDEIDFDLGL